jgi:hypothetical protein
MIDRQGGRILIECDSCVEVFEGEKGEEWKEIWQRAKDDGWRSKQIGSDWVHGCEKCGV